MSFEFWNGHQIMEGHFRWAQWFSSRSRWRTEIEKKAKLQTWRRVEYYCRCHGLQFPRTADIHSSELPMRWVWDSWQRKMGDVRFTSVRRLRMQSSYFARSILQISWDRGLGVINLLSRFLVNHFQAWRNPLRKWNEQLCRKLCWYKHLRRSSNERSTAWSPREIRKFIKRDNGISDLWIGWIHEESLYGTILPSHSRCEWWIWRNRRIMQRVQVTSWWPRFWTYWVDSWTHQNRSSSSSQGHMLSGSTWNWFSGTVHVDKRILLLDCDIQSHASWMNLDTTKKTLLKTLRWVCSASVEKSHAVKSSIEKTDAPKQTGTFEHTDELPF